MTGTIIVAGLTFVVGLVLGLEFGGWPELDPTYQEDGE